jgi:hypothetical protein
MLRVSLAGAAEGRDYPIKARAKTRREKARENGAKVTRHFAGQLLYSYCTAITRNPSKCTATTVIFNNMLAEPSLVKTLNTACKSEKVA